MARNHSVRHPRWAIRSIPRHHCYPHLPMELNQINLVLGWPARLAMLLHHHSADIILPQRSDRAILVQAQAW